MSRITFVLWLAVVALSLGAHDLLASTTYVAGTCKPTLPSYSTISAALAAIPPPTTVLVCPQTFNEQVTITQPVNLQGISSGDSAQPILAPPGGGLTQTATNSFGSTVYYQLWVNNVTGPVNISNITIDGTGNGVSGGCPVFVAGIFYQNSPGTVNRVATRNQKGNGCGIGVFLDGGGSNPSVTIENSSIHDFDNTGIEAGTNSGPSELTATIKSNDVNVTGALIAIYALQGGTHTISGNSVLGGSAGIFTNPGAAGSISGNTITNSNTGIYDQGNGLSVTGNSVTGSIVGIQSATGATGSISGNTITNITNTGIVVGADGVSVTSNKIMTSNPGGIYISSAVATIQGNSITSATYGIYFACTANPNVRSNTLNDVSFGVAAVPQSVNTTNLYYNVATVRTGGC